MNLLLWLLPSSALDGSPKQALQLFARNEEKPVARFGYGANRVVSWWDGVESGVGVLRCSFGLVWAIVSSLP